MSKFEIGDRVRLVDNEEMYPGTYIKGDLATVMSPSNNGDDLISLDWDYTEDRHEGDWFASRFEKVEEPKVPLYKKGDRVRCLREGGPEFTKGKTYEVREDLFEHEYPDYLRVTRDDEGEENGWYASNFEKAPNEKFVILTGLHTGWAIWQSTHDSLSEAEDYIRKCGEVDEDYSIAKVEKTLRVTRTIKEI